MESKEQQGSDRQSGINSTFDCVCCCDEYSSVPIRIQDNAVCLECFRAGIVPQFEDALKDETKYPPRWAGHELNLQDYAEHVPVDLLIRWNEKMGEYLTPVQDRLYCRGTTTATATPGHRRELASQSSIKRPAPGPAKSVSSAQVADISGEHSTTQQNDENCSAFLGSKQGIRRSALAPSVVTVANIPSPASILTLQTMVFETFGRLTECRLLRADPSFAVELTFVDATAAEKFVAGFHNTTTSTGGVLDVSVEDQHISQLKGRIVECANCSTEVCSKCSKVLSKTRVHDCELDADDDPFRGLVRGRDYQQCPKSSCQIKISLMDGCNFMRCKYCQTGFCFVCGEEVSHRSGHWKVGNPCPRFGFPGTARAIHDTAAALRMYEQAAEAAQAEAERRALALQREAAREREHARLMAKPEYRIMLDDQSRLHTLGTWLGTINPARTDPFIHLLSLLFRETEVHVAHLRVLPPGRPMYHLRPETDAAHEGILHYIRMAGLSKLMEWHHITPVTSIISRFNDAWEGAGYVRVMKNHPLGLIRSTHRRYIQQVLHQLPPDYMFAPQWVLQIKQLCRLLDIGIDRYVYGQRQRVQSKRLSNLMHDLAHAPYLQVLAALQTNTEIVEIPFARQMSEALMPVIQAYRLAAAGDFVALQARFAEL